MIFRTPVGIIWPTSPLCSHPSSSKASALAREVLWLVHFACWKSAEVTWFTFFLDYCSIQQRLMGHGSRFLLLDEACLWHDSPDSIVNIRCGLDLDSKTWFWVTISGTSTSFTSALGSGAPTWPDEVSPGSVAHAAAQHSVCPYPSIRSTAKQLSYWNIIHQISVSIVNKEMYIRRKSLTSALMGAEPVTMRRTRPPSLAAIFEKTNQSHRACLTVPHLTIRKLLTEIKT